MYRFSAVALLSLAAVLLSTYAAPDASAQVVTTYYPPQPVVTYYPQPTGLFGLRTTYRPVVSYVRPAVTTVARPVVVAPAPVTAYLTPVAPVPVTTYYAPAAPAPVTTYYAPAAQAPVTTYYAPAPAAPAPTQAYYAPAPAAPAPAQASCACNR